MKQTASWTHSLVSAFAIRGWPDLFLKMSFFLTAIMCLILVIENSLMPEEHQRTLAQLLPVGLTGGVMIGALFFTVVTHQFNLQRELAALAMTDQLTGLPNRRRFLDDFEHCVAQGVTGYFLLLDADKFKRVNDTYGHAAGDACLQAIADKLREIAGPNDLIARLGGEEFIILLNGHSEIRKHRVSATLTAGVTVRLKDRDTPCDFKVTLSVGAAEVAQSLPIERLFHRADLALYAAKSAGRAQMIEWTPTMETITERQSAALH